MGGASRPLTPAQVASAAHLLDPAGFLAWLSRGSYRMYRWNDWVSRQLAPKLLRGNARELIEVAPQHGKSLLIASGVPAWLAEMNPSARIGVCGHNLTIACRSVRYVRDMMAANKDRLRLRLGKQAEDFIEFESVDGRPPGYIRAFGIMSGIPGWSFDTIVLDDLYGSPEEANSPAHRDKVEEVFWASLMTRLSERGNVVGIMHRWHTHDLFGRLLSMNTGWNETRLAALAEKNDPLGRAEGEPLCPELHSREKLERTRAQMPIGLWAALYQGRPLLEDGGLIRREWFHVIEARPERVAARVRYWDPAASRKQRAGDPDYAVGTLMSRLPKPDGRYIVEEIDRGRGTALEFERRLVSAAHRDGRSVAIRIEEEPGSESQAYVSYLVRLLQGYDVRGVRHGAGADKLTRARPFAAQMEIGNVLFVQGPWLRQAIDEMVSFVGDGSEDHDDVPDSVTGAWEALNGSRRWPWEMARAADDRREEHGMSEIGVSEREFKAALAVVSPTERAE